MAQMNELYELLLENITGLFDNLPVHRGQKAGGHCAKTTWPCWTNT